MPNKACIEAKLHVPVAIEFKLFTNLKAQKAQEISPLVDEMSPWLSNTRNVVRCRISSPPPSKLTLRLTPPTGLVDIGLAQACTGCGRTSNWWLIDYYLPSSVLLVYLHRMEKHTGNFGTVAFKAPTDFCFCIATKE